MQKSLLKTKSTSKWTHQQNRHHLLMLSKVKYRLSDKNWCSTYSKTSRIKVSQPNIPPPAPTEQRIIITNLRPINVIPPIINQVILKVFEFSVKLAFLADCWRYADTTPSQSSKLCTTFNLQLDLLLLPNRTFGQFAVFSG